MKEKRVGVWTGAQLGKGGAGALLLDLDWSPCSLYPTPSPPPDLGHWSDSGGSSVGE